MLNRTPKGDLIDNRFVETRNSQGEVLSRNPADLDLAPVPFPFSFENIPEAVASAKRAQPEWQKIGAAARAAVLVRYLEGFQVRGDELARLITFESGIPIAESRQEVSQTAATIAQFVQDIPKQLEPQIDAKVGGVIRWMPRGVAVVVPPAVQACLLPHMQLIPALLCGNSVVLKASRLTPALGQLLMELVKSSGFPAGVFNIIQGDGESARRLVSHPDVDLVFYTGSFDTATNIRKQTLTDYRKVLVLESGGHNSAVLWNDCDYEATLKQTVQAVFASAGQRTTCTGRVIVHTAIYDKFVADFHKEAKASRIGDPMSEGADAVAMGPLVSETVLENYLRFQGMAVREGCNEIMRGKILEREKKGYFVSPSLHAVPVPDAKSIYQTTEVVGPNLAIYRVESIEEAIEIVNLTKYGLVTSIYTKQKPLYEKLAETAKVGLLHWNVKTTEITTRLPWGGLRKSGSHRPMGSHSLYQCAYPIASLES